MYTLINGIQVAASEPAALEESYAPGGVERFGSAPHFGTGIGQAV